VAVYVVVHLDVRDAGWAAAYAGPTAALVKKHGGRYLVRAGRSKMSALEGTPRLSSVMVVVEFPDRAHAKAWYDDPDYQPLIGLRNAGSRADILMVDGV